MNLTELTNRYNNIKPFTTATQLCYIKELQTFMGNKQVNKINDIIIAKLIKHYQSKGNSNKTINDKLSLLRCLLKYAISIRELEYMPIIPHQKVIAKKPTVISRSALAMMLLWCRREGQRDLAKILLIGYYTGLRINNILSITDKNYENGQYNIYDKKVNSYFIMPVSNKIKYIATRHKNFDMTYRQCYYLFNLMKQALKLDEDITIHTLRHSFCSNLNKKQVPLPVIQKLANHKSISSTMRYTHTDEEQLTTAISML